MSGKSNMRITVQASLSTFRHLIRVIRIEKRSNCILYTAVDALGPTLLVSGAIAKMAYESAINFTLDTICPWQVNEAH